MKDNGQLKKRIYLLSFLIPLILYIGIGILLKLYPISENTVLFSDMDNQFVSFYTYFKKVFTSNNNFIYTFSKNLGGDMVGFAAYYLTNPFLFILFLFPDEYLSVGIFVMEILMLSTAGLTMQIFLVNALGKGNIGFSTAYSMMGYVLAYFTLPIYFCNIVLLPIVVLGLHKIFDSYMSYRGDTSGNPDDKHQTQENNEITGKEKKIHIENYVNRDALLYIITLAISIITNYYIGYMLCLFLIIYFIYLCIEKDVFCVGVLVRFAINSILGVMLSCAYLVPVALSLRGQKNAPDTSIMTMRPTFSIAGFYKSFLPCSFRGDYSNYASPYVYIGIISIVFVVVFFAAKNITLREKVAAIFIIGAMFMCLYIHPLNVIWHAFNEPVGFAHRFAFYFSFVLLEIAYKGYSEVLQYNIDNTNFKISNLINDRKSFFTNIILIFLIFELSVNAYHTLKIQIANATPQSEYASFYLNFKPVVDGIKQYDASESERDDNLYRIEKDFQYNMEDSMTYDYIGLTHNSSCETDTVKNFMGKMGFRNQGIWAFYNQGSTAFADCFLGVKYFISRFDTTEKEYNPISAGAEKSGSNEEQKYYVYENEHALCFGSFVNNDKIAAVDTNTDNLFEIQNQIAGAYDFNEKIYEEAAVSEIRVCGNVELSDEFIRHAKENNVLIKNVPLSELENNDGQYVDGNGYIEFDVDIVEGQRNLYMYFTAPSHQGARLYVDGLDWEEYFSDWRWAVEKAGHYSAGKRVPIRMVAVSDSITLDNYYLYEENLEVLYKWRETATKAGADSVELHKISSSHIKGMYNALNDSTLMLTIPYDKGWHIKVDGKKVEQEKALSALMAIKTQKGNHEIEMIYIPQGTIIGAFVSVISLILIIYCVACSMDRKSHLV